MQKILKVSYRKETARRSPLNSTPRKTSSFSKIRQKKNFQGHLSYMQKSHERRAVSLR